MGKTNRKRDNNRDKQPKTKDRVDENTINYYKRVTETLNEGFSNAADKELFLDNVFSQLEEDGPRVCRLASTSRVLEKLVQDASDKNILLLLKTFSQDWSVLLSDRFASHVLQQLISQVPRCLIAVDGTHEDEDTSEPNISGCFLELSNYLKENFDSVKTDTYASHIVRVVLQVLGGVNIGEQVVRSRLSRHQVCKECKDGLDMIDFTPPETFSKVLTKFIKVILKSETINVEITNPMSNPVIQTALLVLHRVDNGKCQKYLKKLVSLPGLFDSNPESIPVIAKDEVGSYMVEQILNLSTPEFYTELYKQMFKGKLLLYAVHPVANFILQRLITNVKEKEHFEEIFGELCGYLEDMLAVNHLGVVTRLAEACHRLGCNQEKLLRCLKVAFHCQEPVERQTKVAPLLLSLTTYEVYYGIADSEEQKEDKPSKEIPILSTVNYHGSVLCQHLLKFGNPKQMVTSLLELKPVELKNLSCDACGSHVIDSFFQSKTIGEKSREAFINRMKGQFFDIACGKFGSRTLEMIWKHINTSHKVVIATELSKQEGKLRGNQFGFFIHKNFGMHSFLHRRKDWEESQTANVKKRKMFEDILGGSDKSGKKVKPDVEDENSLRLEESDEDIGTNNNQPFTTKVQQGKKQFKQKVPDDKKQFKQGSKNKEYQIKDKKMKLLFDEVTGKKKKKK